jgi:MSHA pilin protein MshA
MSPVRRRGLTSVELAVAVLATGVLAVWGLPQLGETFGSDQRQREQRVARLQAARGAVQSAAVLLHGVARARADQPQRSCEAGGHGPNPPRLDADGNGNLCTADARVQVAMLYPAPTLAGIVAAAGLVPVPGTPSAAQLAHEGFEAHGTGDRLRLQLQGAPDPARCAFDYEAPRRMGEAPVISAVATTGC